MSRSSRFTHLPIGLVILCVFGGANALAQAPLRVSPLPNPNLDLQRSGRVDVLLKLADGRYMVGGLFERIGTMPANGVARLLPDGSVDGGFSPPALPLVRDMAVDSLGRVYVLNSSTLTRLRPDGSIDPAFAVVTPSGLSQFEIIDDQIFIAGEFSSFGGSPRTRLAKLNLAGVLDADWAPAPNATVSSMLAPGNGFLYIGGSFTQVGGAARTGLARIALTGSGAIDSWAPQVTLQPSGTAHVRELVSAGSQLFIGGDFSHVAGVAHARLAKLELNGAGAPDNGWTAGLSLFPELFAVHAGHLYVGRNATGMTASQGSNSLAAVHIARFSVNGAGALDLAFNPLADTPGTALDGPLALVPADGGDRFVLGGGFADLSSGTVRLGLAAFNADGSFDALSAVPETTTAGSVATVQIDNDGSAFIQGDFRRANGGLRRNAIKLTPAGLIDGVFRAPNTEIDALALDPGQAIYIADRNARVIRKLSRTTGDPVAGFTAIPHLQGIGRLQVAGVHLYASGSAIFNSVSPSLAGFARMTLATGTLDGSFRPDFGTGGKPVQVLHDPGSTSLFLVGGITSVNGQPRAGIARFNATSSTLDLTWNPGFAGGSSTNPSDAALDGAGGIFVQGFFTSVNGQPCVAPVRLLIAGTGTVDNGFNCVRSPSFPNRLAFANGALFASRIGEVRRFVVSAGGAPDPNWSVATSVDRLVTDNTRVWLAGSFTSLTGVPRRSVAAFLQVERVFSSGFE